MKRRTLLGLALAAAFPVRAVPALPALPAERVLTLADLDRLLDRVGHELFDWRPHILDEGTLHTGAAPLFRGELGQWRGIRIVRNAGGAPG